MQNDNSFNQNLNMSVELQHDIVKSMGEQIDELSFSLSHISLKNYELQKQMSMQEIKRCPNNHPLRYMYTKLTTNTNWRSCDRCNKKVQTDSNVFWNCTKCDYDQCRACGGHRQTVCVYGHPLQFVSKYLSNQYRCDICHSKNLKSGWHCDCDFDVCENCYNNSE